MPFTNAMKVALIILAVILVAMACAPAFVSSDPENMDEFATSIELNNGMHAVTAGNPGAPMVLFVHGTPGSWHAFEDYLNHPRLQESVYMVAIDRAGFGRSDGMDLAPSLKSQSQLLENSFALNANEQKILLVGHSLGGSIGFRSAIDHPEEIGALLAISSAMSSNLGKPRWYNRLAALPVIKHVIPGDLKLANEEVLPLTDELRMIEEDLATITMPVTVIQGDKDPLVNTKNADFAQSRLTSAEFKLDRFPDEGHFIVWSHVDHVVDEILRLVNRISELEKTDAKKQGTNETVDGLTIRVGQ